MARLHHAILVAVATMILASCAGDDVDPVDVNTEPAKEIDLVYAYDDLFTEPLKQIADRVEQESGITVNLVLAGESYEDADQRVQADLAAGSPPALAMVGLNRLQPYVDAERAQPIQPFIDATSDFAIDDFDPKFLDLMRIDDELYGLPYVVSTPVLYLNEDAFTKAGLDPDDPPQTWEEVEQAATQITSTRAARHGIHWAWDITGNWVFQAMTESAGGALLSDDRSTVTFAEGPGVHVAEYLTQQVSAGIMPLISESDARDAFLRGDVAMIVTSTAYLEGIKKGADFVFRTAAFPVPDGGEPRVPGGGNGFAILADEPSQQAAAWTVLKALTDIEGNTITVKATGYMPVNRTATESEAHLADYVSEPNRQTSLRQIPALVPWLNFPGTHGREATEVINDALFAAMNGDKTPADALADAAQQVEGLLP